MVQLPIILLALLAPACATIDPPADPDDPVTIYIADYGRHASLILPSDARWTEYAYGEWRWFALQDNWLLRAPGILLLPSVATLGRRTLPPPRPLVLESITDSTGAARAIPIVVPADAANRLSAALDARFDRARDTLIYNADYDMEFVRDPDPYWLARNCNSQVARWLHTLGCRVRGPTVFSGFCLAGPTERPAPPVRSPGAAASR